MKGQCFQRCRRAMLKTSAISQFRYSHYRKDIYLLQSMQRKMTKRIQRKRDISYEARFKILNLCSLERRKLRGGPIKVLKCIGL